jgi:hypothetical protein
MPLNPLGVLDLSLVTGRLIDLLTNCIDASPLWAVLDPTNPLPKPTFSISVSGSMPDATHHDQGCTLSICLIHVSADKFQRNFVAVPPPVLPIPPGTPPQRALPIPQHPLGLDLFYLLTAYDADKSYIHEQQVMSIALKCFHENPIVRANVPIPPSPQTVKEEFTLTMEVQTSDDVARLWQAIERPYRLSVFYKVSVVFLTPPAPSTTVKQAVRVSLAVDPATIPFASSGQVVGTSSTATFTSPNTGSEVVNIDYSPAVVTPSQRIFLYGAGLTDNPQVYILSPPDYSIERDVTSWKDTDATEQTDSRLVLDMPSTIAAGQTPTPGLYQMLAGSATNRTNATPFSIAARVDVTTVPPAPPVLPGPPPYTVNGMGFIAARTQVLLETFRLAEVIAPAVPAPGQFCVNDLQTLVFAPPAALRTGNYAVRIRVNQVESPPAWWIKV